MSSSFKGGDTLRRYLADLAKKGQHAPQVKVGILSGATYDDGTSVAQVAAVQEFGSPVQNIPARPFMRTTIAEKSDGWPRALALLLQQGRTFPEALEVLGMQISTEMRDTISALKTPELATSTKAAKRRKGSKYPDHPPIDTEHVWESITSQVEDDDGS